MGLLQTSASDRELKGRRILVVGFGRSGLAMVRFLVRRGAEVTLNDRQSAEQLAGPLQQLPEGVRTVLGGHPFSLTEEAFDMGVVSPGVDLRQPLLRELRLKGVPLIGEIELAYRFMPNPAPIAAITGTNGKSTVTTMVAECLRRAGRDWFVGGNLGTPFLEGVEKESEGTAHYDGYLLEISSFQLESVAHFRPRVGVLLNVMPDHMDRYRDVDEYGLTKLRLFSGMQRKDDAVINGDDPWTYYHYARGLENRLVFSDRGPVPEGVYRVGQQALCTRSAHRYDLSVSKIPGAHNRRNWLAAILTAECLGLPSSAIQSAVAEYRGLPHRLQPAGTVRGVFLINDSKATNVASVQVALDAVQPPVWLLLGGMAKGDDFGDLDASLKAKVRGVFLYGRDREAIAAQLKGRVRVERVLTMEEAAAAALASAQPGDTVLLSPGCASFDQFTNYAVRGKVFMDLAAQWTREQGE